MDTKKVFIIGTVIVVAVLSILKLRKTTDNEDDSEQFKEVTIPIDQINSRRWELIARALQGLQGENGQLNMSKLTFVEEGKSLIIKYYPENNSA